MNRATFVIDLARCTGCRTCQIACKDRAAVPDDLDLLRVEERETGEYPRPTLTYRVLHCFHCAEPLCADVCPTQAISTRDGGLVVLAAAECIDCGACIDACPFDAIALHPDGVAIKCDGCSDEVASGWEPTCVRACPMRALGYRSVGMENGDWPFESDSRVVDPDFDDRGIGPDVLYLRRPANSDNRSPC